MASVDPEYDLVIQTFSAICPRYEKLGFEQLAEPERVIFCTWQFVCEVNNGGFHQFLKNPSGVFAEEAVLALEKVEMPFAASLLRRALAAFPGTPGDFDLLNELTEAFFDSAEDAYELQATYVRRHRDGFHQP